MKIDMHKACFKKLCIVSIVFSVFGCTNDKSVILGNISTDVYTSLTNKAIDFYIRRNRLLTKKNIDYYKCYDKIIDGKTSLDKISFGKEIPCKNSEWQHKVAYIKNIPVQIDIFDNGTYRQTIFLNDMRHMGRYYDFDKSFVYYDYSKNYDYYDDFNCPSYSNGNCVISRIYKYEDASLHPSSESYEAELLRETTLEKRKNRYKFKAKAFLKKYESISRNIIEFKVGKQKVVIDKKNKTYTTYKAVKNKVIKVSCNLIKGECSVGISGTGGN